MGNYATLIVNFLRYVYRFVCDLHGLLGYTAQEIHAMVDLQPLAATAGASASANVTNNNNHEAHSNNNNNQPHEDISASAASADGVSSLMAHHPVKIEQQVQKAPRHIFE